MEDKVDLPGFPNLVLYCMQPFLRLLLSGYNRFWTAVEESCVKVSLEVLSQDQVHDIQSNYICHYGNAGDAQERLQSICVFMGVLFIKRLIKWWQNVTHWASCNVMRFLFFKEMDVSLGLNWQEHEKTTHCCGCSICCGCKYFNYGIVNSEAELEDEGLLYCR